MTRRNNRRFNTAVQNKLKAQQKIVNTNVEVEKEVQGPQLNQGDPKIAAIELEADLQRKYLGTQLQSLGPSLFVITNNTQELIQSHGYRIFRQIANDPEVDASMDALLNGVCSQQMTVSNPLTQGEDGYELAGEVADFVFDNILDLPIDDWRKEQLRNALIYGNAVSEIDWKIENDSLKIKRLRLQDPETYGFMMDQWNEIYGTVPLNQATARYTLGNFVALSDLEIKELKGVVPRFKTAIWTWEMQGTDPRGRSILNPVYIPWWSKQRALEEWACWLGRYSQPSIWATPGPNAVAQCDPKTGVIIHPTEVLLKILQNFQSGSALALPYGSEVQLLQATGSIEPFIRSLEYFNKEITRALLGQNLATSEGNTSSRAAAEIHSLVLRQLIGTLRQFMSRMLMVEIIKPLVQANYGFIPRKLYPVISLGDSDGFPPSITEIALLFQSGYFTNDQLPKIDKMIGVPIRQSQERVGAGNLPPWIPEGVDPKEMVKLNNGNSSNSADAGSATTRLGSRGGGNQSMGQAHQ